MTPVLMLVEASVVMVETTSIKSKRETVIGPLQEFSFDDADRV